MLTHRRTYLNRKEAVADILAKLDDSKRAVAKLMARENITVVISPKARTASFDIVRRILTIPNWGTLTIEQFDMLIGHEVGHALFTDNQYVERVIKKKSVRFGHYLNIVEDARIERKMKNSYPGLRRIFYTAYEEFHKNGPILQGTKTHLFDPRDNNKPVAIAGMRLIDRINLYYKIGAFAKVPFAPEERIWIHRIDRCAELKEAIEIAEDLFKYAKDKEQDDAKKRAEQPKQKQPKTQSQDAGNDASGEESDDDSEPMESDDKKPSKSKSSKSKKDEETDDDSADATDEAGDEAEEDGDSDDSDSDSEESDDTDSDSDVDSSDDADEDADGPADADDTDDDEDEDSEASGASKDDAEDESDDEAPEDGDDSSDDESEPIGNPNDPSYDNDPDSKTAKDMEDILERLANDGANSAPDIRNLLYTSLSPEEVNKRTITASEFLKLVTTTLGPAMKSPTLDRIETKWNELYVKTARQMAQEFDRRKNAREQQRSSTARTGRLDMSKLHQYKFTDDLFKRVTLTPRGQSHGIAMLIDASDSMRRVFADVIDQTLLFAHFAFLAKIPFEAYLFTDKNSTFTQVSNGALTLAAAKDGRLVGLINTNTDRAQFRNQCRVALMIRNGHSELVPDISFRNDCRRIPYAISLGGTPLFTGLLTLERHVERMKRTLQLDKMIVSIISDGADTEGIAFIDQKVNNRGSVVDDFQPFHEEMNVIIRDMYTKRNHILVNPEGKSWGGNTIITFLLDSIAERHNASVIYQYLIRAEEGATAAYRMCSRAEAGISRYANIPEEVAAALKEEGQYALPADKGIGTLALILLSTSLRMNESDFSDVYTKNLSDKQVGEKFVETMMGQVNHRKFVKTVIPYIA